MKKLVWLGLVAVAPMTAAYATDYTYKTLDVPSDSFFGTWAGGVTNAGHASGSFQNGVISEAHHGFLYSGGTFTTIDNPGAQQGGTNVSGMNDKDQVAGSYFQAFGGGYHGFIYQGGSFTPVDDPLAVGGTVATGINNSGTVVGLYYDSSLGTHHFIETSDGTYADVAPPTALSEAGNLVGINSTGIVVGSFNDAAGTHGYVEQLALFRTIAHPSAPNATFLTGVNANLALTGYYTDTSGNNHGFVYSGGVFSDLADPDAAGVTVANGISDNGTVAGSYVDTDGTTHGFLATPTVIPARARDFINNLGVNTHLFYTSHGYQDVNGVISALQYLGMTNVRDSPAGNSAQVWPQIAAGAGVKFDAFIPTDSKAGMQSALARITPLAKLGILNFVEGGNEEDNGAATDNNLTYTAQFQMWVYQTGHALKLPVINMSFGQGWTAANNWTGDYGNVGDLSAICDYGNAHTFPEPNSGEPDSTVQALTRDAHLAASQRPVIHTELGWDSRTPEDQVPANMLEGIMDAAASGAPKTYLYALFDDVGRTFGLMNADATPKPEGVAVHNLVTLLADAGQSATTFTPTTLTYNITTGADGDRTYLFQKSDGSYWIALWNEYSASHTVTVTMPTNAAHIQVFAPLTSTSAVQTVSNASAISVSLDGPPVLIAVTPPAGGSTPPPPPPNTITSQASNTTINGNAGTTAISVYGTNDVINGGSGTYTVLALKGGNTVNTDAGNATVYIGGASSNISVGSGTVLLRDSGTNNKIAFSAPGVGTTEVYGYVLGNGDVLNFTNVLAGTTWNGSSATVGNFLKLTTQGSTTIVSVNTSGMTGGTTYPVVTLHGYTNLSLTTLLAHSTL